MTKKGFISKIYRQLIQLNVNKQTKKQTSIKKWAEVLSRYFSKDIQMANSHTKKCSTLLIMKERQAKTIMWHHSTYTKMAIIKRLDKNKCWRGWEYKWEPFTLLAKTESGAIILKNSLSVAQNFKHRISVWSSISTP